MPPSGPETSEEGFTTGGGRPYLPPDTNGVADVRTCAGQFTAVIREHRRRGQRPQP
ncbi:hypothetical protein [Polymorphospora sp. NPDC050346]|uniref:hypothetical protein n=1 Tax=Polymorphospora sp. NPDC050346 TaxID=3155780 RepID=UPI0033C98BB9